MFRASPNLTLHVLCTNCNEVPATLRHKCRSLIKQMHFKNEGATISRNVGQCLTIDMAEHSRRPESGVLSNPQAGCWLHNAGHSHADCRTVGTWRLALGKSGRES